jgi:putative two-component system response regulator
MSETLGRSARILVADDEREIRDVLDDLLGTSHDCTTVGSAEEALAHLRAGEFDLVISDIAMGGMSGLEMVPHVLKSLPDTSVILMSGMQTIESAIGALRAGAFDYIVKPFDIKHVEAAVNRALEHHALRAAKRRYEIYLEEMVEQRTAELDRALRSLEDAYRSTLKALTASLEARDAETHGHSERVVSFSLRLGRELRLDREQMRALEFGSLLHDIGKIGVPDEILRKPMALTPSEWQKMREHPLHGERILRGVEFLEGASRVVAQHHEKWDGSGYPLGLRGDEIDLNARIFAVADAFDAITSNRVYRLGRSYDEAVVELEQFSGRQFDPQVIEAFHRVASEEWEEMRRRSVEARQEKRPGARHFEATATGALIESRMNALIN